MGRLGRRCEYVASPPRVSKSWPFLELRQHCPECPIFCEQVFAPVLAIEKNVTPDRVLGQIGEDFRNALATLLAVEHTICIGVHWRADNRPEPDRPAVRTGLL
jgi:hypothetical protein